MERPSAPHSPTRGAPLTGSPKQRVLIWYWGGIWLVLPLVKLTAHHLFPPPAEALRLTAFYTAGMLLTLGCLLARGEWPLLRPLFSRPVAGLAGGLLLFGGLSVLAMALGALGRAWLASLAPLPQGGFAEALRPLIQALVEGTAWLDFTRGRDGLGLAGLFTPAVAEAQPGWNRLLGGSTAALFESWLFQAMLLWRGLYWLLPNPAETPRGLLRQPRALAWLLFSSLYFAALHFPQPIASQGAAFLGSIIIGALLLRLKNVWMAVSAHLMFNLLNP